MGEMVSSWTDAGLLKLQWVSERPNTDQSSSNTNTALATAPSGCAASFDELLGQYFLTGQADFTEIFVDPTGWTPLSRRIYDACRQIESGTTATYGQLAASVGNPSASRAVGAAMARNRVLLVIPCHRVIASDGKLRGFSAPGGLVTKQRLLDLESNNQCNSQSLPLFDHALESSTSD
ncbi:Methylated-DNA--protein-cysteine methyltransferase [Rubripirellula amarantea]|uniref:methylated-DNA--[protein]-cysteine S-methyltransferase n=2 Tax=Rubripirellula amarantea TaxID=2527999 RepID=A0A5C5WF45_9BACT|nr:Methylated-DNA--protein-cysteine methyltransferase [Rubripirellula amarantea]